MTDVIAQRLSAIPQEKRTPSTMTYNGKLVKYKTQQESLEVIRVILGLDPLSTSVDDVATVEHLGAKRVLDSIVKVRNKLKADVDSLKSRLEETPITKLPSIYDENPNAVFTDPSGKLIKWEIYRFCMVVPAVLERKHRTALACDDADSWGCFEKERNSFETRYVKLTSFHNNEENWLSLDDLEREKLKDFFAI